MKKILIFVFVWVFFQSFCLASFAGDEFKVGYLCVGPISDSGWNCAHNIGRLYLESKMPNVKTTLAERVPESAEAERVMEKMIAQGNKLIFTTSYGFLDPALRVAKRHPDVVFMQVNRFDNTKNLGTYFSHQYQPLYVAGTVAGRMTKTNKLGFIAAHPVPPLLQAVNAFTMGARSVNPKVTTKVIWINSWSDPTLEAEGIKGLVESGIDVIGHIQDNQNTILSTAESLGIYSVGCYSDAHEKAPKGWLTGACLEWGPFYVETVKSVINHTWQTGIRADGMARGYIKLSTIGNVVPANIRKQTLALEQDIKSGKFVVFQGPLKDRDGMLRLAAGQKPDIKWLANMDFFVAGVDGALPRK